MQADDVQSRQACFVRCCLKQNFGVSFKVFYSAIKIEYAKILIKTSSYKTYQISDMLGYSSPDYFTKIFKEATGMTPSEYKSE